MASDRDQARIARDRRTEYQALRSELNQADQSCLIMTGFIFTALGALFTVDDTTGDVLWITSFLCFIALMYYTEKRFGIRRIAAYISSEISTEESGFNWERYVRKLREQNKLRPTNLLRPYNAEVLICVLGSLSPLTHDNFRNLEDPFDVSKIAWLVTTLVVVVLGIVNAIKYKRL